MKTEERETRLTVFHNIRGDNYDYRCEYCNAEFNTNRAIETRLTAGQIHEHDLVYQPDNATFRCCDEDRFIRDIATRYRRWIKAGLIKEDQSITQFLERVEGGDAQRESDT